MSITLRDYQLKTKENVYKALNRGIKRQLIVLATGMGKSFLTCDIIKDLKKEGKKTLVLVDRKVLAWQWKDSLLQIDPTLSIGVEMNSNKGNKYDDVVVASLQTLGRKGVKRIKKFDPDMFDVCITDEAHKFPTAQGLRVLEYFGFGKDNFKDENLLIGATATAKRTDNVSLGTLYDDVVADYDLAYGQANGWLTDFDWNDIETGTDISDVRVQKGERVKKEYHEKIDTDNRNELIIKSYFDQLKEEPTVTFSLDVEHAYHLKEIFNHHGATAEVIEANTDERKRDEIIEAFKQGQINNLINFNVVSEGFDAPNIKGLMLTREIGSPTAFTQMLGRGIRPSYDAFVDAFDDPQKRRQSIANSTKPQCKVLDFHDHDAAHKIRQTVATLYGLNPDLQPKQKKNFYKEVVEPIEEAKNEKGINPQDVTDIDELDMLVKNRKINIQSYSTNSEIEHYTDREWMDIGNDSYEIIYQENNKILMIEKDSAKESLLEKQEWNLYETDSKKGITKKLQTFNSLSGAFKVADEYAESQGWNSKFVKRADWMKEGVTEAQYKKLYKFFTYRKGQKNEYCKFRLLNERYEDTGIRKILWKSTNEVLDKGMASKILTEFFENKKKNK